MFTCIGNTIGKCAISAAECLTNQQINTIVPNEESDFRFIYYLLNHHLDYIKRLGAGAATPIINKTTFENIALEVPPFSIQQRLADTLSAYDDLIENNLKRIALLEESARRLYREWFVRLRFPGHEHTRIVDGVPEGWEKKELRDLCDEIRQQIAPDKVDPDTPYIGLEHMPRRSITLSEWGEAADVQSAKHKFADGDILFGKIRPYFHKVGVCFTEGIASTDATVIRPMNTDLHSLVLMTVSNDLFVAQATQSSYGAKMPRANWNVLEKFIVVVPPEGLLKQFAEFVCSIVSQLKLLVFQNRKLKQARDLLLPRLMNGEI